MTNYLTRCMLFRIVSFLDVNETENPGGKKNDFFCSFTCKGFLVFSYVV